MVKDYWAEILDPLTNGAYRLVVTADEAQTLETYYSFNGIVDLPIVSDRLFQVQSDSQGNLIWTWETSKALYTLSQSKSTKVCAFITIYLNGECTGILWAKVPSNLGCFIIPAAKVHV